jgi:hypothetical protein
MSAAQCAAPTGAESQSRSNQFDALALSPGLMVRSRAIVNSPNFLILRTRRLEP